MTNRTTAAICLLSLLASGIAQAQRGGAQPSARDSAPIDLTGTWVSVVSEDWRHRMATPRVGDFESVPLNGNGRSTAAAWDLAADNAAGLECRAFGVGGIVRQPGRMNIAWQNDSTLRIDFDAGSQTRLLHFGGNLQEPEEKTWQGFSRAVWQRPPGARGGGAGAPRGGAGAVGSDEGIAAGGGGRGQRGGPPPSASINEGGSLEVRTTQFLSGYLRKNGVPYSEDAVITEYIHRLPGDETDDEWLHVVTVVEDPTYLSQPFHTSTQFKREPNDRNFEPTPCRTAPPPP